MRRGLGAVRVRLSGARPGRRVPADAVVCVGGPVETLTGGRWSFVVTVGTTGPVRVVYGMDDPVGPVWLRQIAVPWRRRAAVLAAVLAAAGMHTPDDRHSSDGGCWLHVAAGGRSRWLRLPVDRRVGGIAVWAMVTGLVPAWVWREIRMRRSQVAMERPEPNKDAAGDAEIDGNGRAEARRPAEVEGWPGIRHGGTWGTSGGAR